MTLKNIPFTDILKQIDSYVTDKLFYQRPAPEKTRRRYYPRWNDARKIAKRARDAAIFSGTQLARLRRHVEYLSEMYPGNTTLLKLNGVGILEQTASDIDALTTGREQG